MSNNKNARARHHFEEVERAEVAATKREERLRRRRAKRERKRALKAGEQVAEGE